MSPDRPTPMPPMPPTGRFAPSPTGPLHAGSLVAALASWLDARAHGGRWLVRIEDVDAARCPHGMAGIILGQLAQLGLQANEPPQRQSERSVGYEAALRQLLEQGWAYPCGCTRREIDDVWLGLGLERQRHEDRVYPGTCRTGLHGRPERAVRLLTQRAGHDSLVTWQDRRLGAQQQDVAREVGDFVLKRADGPWAYQLAVVVDDARQGVTHVVRGADLADNTARQIWLQRALGLPTPSYLHVPLVLAADGEKLSKQNGAGALDLHDPVKTLQQAAQVLGLPPVLAANTADWLQAAVPLWAARWLSQSAAEAMASSRAFLNAQDAT